MRRLLSSFPKMHSTARCRMVIVRASGLLAVAGVLSFNSAFAKDPDETDAKSTNKAAVTRDEANSDAAAVPECLQKLKLTAKQEEQVKDIVRNYDRSISTTWKKFSDRYMQTIKMESSMLAAIEDNFTDAQRQQVRDQRSKTAQHEKLAGSTEKRGEGTDKPKDVVKDEIASAGVSLTPEQEAMADKIHGQYRTHLRSLNRDIQGLHVQLVSLEADRLAAIEKVLTKDQLTQLRTNRQSAPDAPHVAVSKTE